MPESASRLAETPNNYYCTGYYESIGQLLYAFKEKEVPVSDNQRF